MSTEARIANVHWLKRLFRLGLSRPTDIFTAWLMIFTGVLSLETAFNVWVLLRTDETLHGTMVAGNRAWITPDVKLVVASVHENNPVEMRLTYTNRGREPANDVRTYNTVKLLAPSEVNDWSAKEGVSDRRTCQDKIKKQGSRTLPHDEGFRLTVSSEKTLNNKDVDDFSDRMKDIYISGCVTYRTLAGEVWTYYCRFVRLREGGGTLEAIANKDSEVDTEHCGTGNHIQ